MTRSYVVRFAGRFVFACEGPAPNPTSVTALAIDMTHEPTLDCEPHRVLLTASRTQVKPIGRRSDLAFLAPSAVPGAESHLVSWDLAGLDVRVGTGEGGSVELREWDSVPDVGRLSGGSLDRGLLSGPTQGTPVAARIHFRAGTLTPFVLDALDHVVFEPVLPSGGHGTPEAAPLPDSLDLGLSVEGSLGFDLGPAGQPTSRVEVASGDSDPCVVTITNLCNDPSPDELREFAAFYLVVQRPPSAPGPPVPVRAAASPAPASLIMGRRVACTKVARVHY